MNLNTVSNASNIWMILMLLEVEMVTVQYLVQVDVDEVDGVPLDVDGVPLAKDVDGEPLAEEEEEDIFNMSPKKRYSSIYTYYSYRCNLYKS